jgi:amidophosphoribosyltransferase
VDTPTKRELIAANQKVDEIRQFIGADTLAYLSLGNLRTAVRDDDAQYCYACYTGDYPTDLVNIEDLMAARKNC